MLREQAQAAIDANETIQDYRKQLIAVGNPVDSLIDDIVGKRLTASEKVLLDAIIKALRSELAKYAETKPTTILGKIGRFFASIFG